MVAQPVTTSKPRPTSLPFAGLVAHKGVVKQYRDWMGFFARIVIDTGEIKAILHESHVDTFGNGDYIGFEAEAKKGDWYIVDADKNVECIGHQYDVVQEITLDLRYIGNPKEREGVMVSLAQVEGGWNVAIPQDVQKVFWQKRNGERLLLRRAGQPVGQGYYALLGVGNQATESEIKTAYRRLAFQAHPDRGGDADEFRKIQSAYETLSDPSRRRKYDMLLQMTSGQERQGVWYNVVAVPLGLMSDFRSPYKYGQLRVKGRGRVEARFDVEEILDWAILVRPGQIMEARWDVFAERMNQVFVNVNWEAANGK